MRTTYLIAQVVLTLLLPSIALAIDTDGDGVPDGVDVCCNTLPGVRVDATGRPLGDLDGDCNVDQSDFAIFQANMTGPITQCVPTPEVCNGLDDDCDCLVDNGASASCPNVTNATKTCQNATCGFTCNAGFANCNGNNADGCEVNLNAAACIVATDMGTVRGDAGSDVVSFDGRGARWQRVTISDAAGGSGITARIRLTPPPGINYDLYVYCGNCGSLPVLSSTIQGSAVDSLFYVHNDSAGDDGRTLLIEVKYVSGEDCGNYHLEVAGNIGGSGNFTCP